MTKRRTVDIYETESGNQLVIEWEYNATDGCFHPYVVNGGYYFKGNLKHQPVIIFDAFLSTEIRAHYKATVFREGDYNEIIENYKANSNTGMEPGTAERMYKILTDVENERRRQIGKWGTESDYKRSIAEWVTLIQDYAGWARTMAGMNSMDKARNRLIQIAAMAVAAVEALDRNEDQTKETSTGTS